jgi:exodeoxyribonuclease-3
LARLPYRLIWEECFKAYVSRLDQENPVIICGDLNVAHEDIDLKNPVANRNNAGFSPEERAAFGRLLDAGFVDTFRYFYPTVTGAYSWWSYMFSARKNNAGWRIDYFLTSERLKARLQDAAIHSQIMGSDHCPVELTLF